MKKLLLAVEIEKLSKTIDEIIPHLSHKFNGYEFPYEKVKLSLDDFLQLTLIRKTSTLMFGHELNQQLEELWLKDEKPLIYQLRNAFWWPAVEQLWEFQCFSSDSVDSNEKGINDIYYLVRIGSMEINAAITNNDDIYWLGVKTKKCYTDHD